MNPSESQGTYWHLSIIPLYMTIGNPGILVTLVALKMGASVTELGVISAAGSVASFIFSMVWGRLSDLTSSRKAYLIFLSLAMVPVFLALSLAAGIPQLMVLYALGMAIGSGVAPIAVMYTVECCVGRNWNVEVSKLNSIMSVGNILGLVTYTFGAGFYETHTLFLMSSAFCLASAALLWRLGREPSFSLERHGFAVSFLHGVESILSPRPLLQHLDLRILMPPRRLRRLKPLQLLVLASFVHWMGMSACSIGMTPLMKDLGLSDSLILALSVCYGVAAAASFAWIAPRMGGDYKRLISRLVLSRAALIVCWAALPFFMLHPVSYVFVFPLLITAMINVFYAMLWLPLTNFAISQAPEDRKSSVVGQLMAATNIAGAIGSILGGVVINAYGYSAGFLSASAIVLLSLPLLSRIDVLDTD